MKNFDTNHIDRFVHNHSSKGKKMENNMHQLTNNIFNIPDYAIESNKLSKRKLNYSMNVNSLKELRDNEKRINDPFLSDSKSKNKIVLPPIEGRNNTVESKDKKSILTNCNQDLLIKNRNMFEKRYYSINSEKPIIHKSESLLKNINQNLIYSFDAEKYNDRLDHKNDLSLIVDKECGFIEIIPKQSSIIKKPPLPPRAMSSYLQQKKKNCDNQIKIEHENTFEYVKNIPEQRDKSRNKLELSNQAIEHYNTTELANLSIQSVNNSHLKEKNFYDQNKCHMKEKMLKSLDIQKKNQSLYISKIWKEEQNKRKIIDDYIEKGIHEKSEKDKIHEIESKKEKINVILV